MQCTVISYNLTLGNQPPTSRAHFGQLQAKKVTHEHPPAPSKKPSSIIMETAVTTQSSIIVATPMDLSTLPPSPFDIAVSRLGKPGHQLPLSGETLTQLNADATSSTPRVVSWNDSQLVNVREYEISETCPSEQDDWEDSSLRLCCTLQ